MSNKKVLTDIMDILALFRLGDKNNMIRLDDLVILIPESDYKTFLRGYSDFINVDKAEITFYGIRCRKTKESKIIIGVEG